VGAGKTTFYEAYLKEAFPTLVPALRHQQQPFLDERRSFAVEDIRVDTQLLDQAKAAGFSTKVLFISTEDANLNVGRVLVRMSRGGQAVPVSSVVDSYRESTKNLSEVSKHADELLVYDNTAHRRGFRIVEARTRALTFSPFYSLCVLGPAHSFPASGPAPVLLQTKREAPHALLISVRLARFMHSATDQRQA
jgi:hypothetical protein